jgi:D-alanine-D-alanine ligase
VKKLRVLALMHVDLVPPESLRGLAKADADEMRTEWDVVTTLTEMGHEVHKLGVFDDLSVIKKAIDEHQPDVAFNLLEEFDGTILYDSNVVSYLEMLRLPYTGCTPRGLLLAHDKALSKKILHYHRIRVPDFAVFPIGRKVKRPRHLEYPLIVKSLVADASAGISQASVVRDDEKLAERVEFVHRRLHTDAIAEQFIDGRELYVGVLGNERLEVLPVWEMEFKAMPEDAEHIATERVKWDPSYQKRRGIDTVAARGLDAASTEVIGKLCRRIFRLLDLSGYARLDFRMDANGQLWLLEANPNPNIAQSEDFALSAKHAGTPYPVLLQKILNIAMGRAFPPSTNHPEG